MQNIIICGQMGSGKDTLADMITKKYGHVKRSLGGKIHSECRLHGSESREEMQKYGQAMRQIFGIDVWCDYLWKQCSESNELIVINDGRQLNEFEYFKSKGFLTIGITAHFDLRQDRIFLRDKKLITWVEAKHETELQAAKCFDKCEIVIFNNFGRDALERVVDGLWKDYKEYLKGIVDPRD